MINVDEIPKMIGSILIYANQVAAARKILELFKHLMKYPLLFAPPQIGKFGVALEVAVAFIKKCIADNIKFKVIWLNHIADNELRMQTKMRIIDSGYEDYIEVLHHGNIQNFKFDPTVKHLIILDECHIALKKNRPLDKFFEKLNIRYGESKETWGNKNIEVLSMSATPYAQSIKNCLDNDIFVKVTIEPSKDYIGLKEIRDKGRIFQSQSIVDKKTRKISKFGKDRISEFMENCVRYGNGYLIIRSKGDVPNIIKEYIEEVYGSQIGYSEFSDKEGNIALIDPCLQRCPSKPRILIIRGCLRAGKTLTTTKYIRGWIEPPNSNPDAMAQSTGRTYGHDSGSDWSRDKDIFPIYCNIRDVDVIIESYDNLNVVPKGHNNKSTVIKRNNIKKYDVFESIADIIVLANQNGLDGSVADWTSVLSRNMGTKKTKDVLCKRIFRDISHGDRRVIMWDMTYVEFKNKVEKTFARGIITEEIKNQHLEYYKKCEEKYKGKLKCGSYLFLVEQDQKPTIEIKSNISNLINSDVMFA